MNQILIQVFAIINHYNMSLKNKTLVSKVKPQIPIKFNPADIITILRAAQTKFKYAIVTIKNKQIVDLNKTKQLLPKNYPINISNLENLSVRSFCDQLEKIFFSERHNEQIIDLLLKHLETLLSQNHSQNLPILEHLIHVFIKWIQTIARSKYFFTQFFSLDIGRCILNYLTFQSCQCNLTSKNTCKCEILDSLVYIINFFLPLSDYQVDPQTKKPDPQIATKINKYYKDICQSLKISKFSSIFTPYLLKKLKEFTLGNKDMQKYLLQTLIILMEKNKIVSNILNLYQEFCEQDEEYQKRKLQFAIKSEANKQYSVIKAEQLKLTKQHVLSRCQKYKNKQLLNSLIKNYIKGSGYFNLSLCNVDFMYVPPTFQKNIIKSLIHNLTKQLSSDYLKQRNQSNIKYQKCQQQIKVLLQTQPILIPYFLRQRFCIKFPKGELFSQQRVMFFNPISWMMFESCKIQNDKYFYLIEILLFNNEALLNQKELDMGDCSAALIIKHLPIVIPQAQYFTESFRQKCELWSTLLILNFIKMKKICNFLQIPLTKQDKERTLLSQLNKILRKYQASYKKNQKIQYILAIILEIRSIYYFQKLIQQLVFDDLYIINVSQNQIDRQYIEADIISRPDQRKYYQQELLLEKYQQQDYSLIPSQLQKQLIQDSKKLKRQIRQIRQKSKRKYESVQQLSQCIDFIQLCLLQSSQQQKMYKKIEKIPIKYQDKCKSGYKLCQYKKSQVCHYKPIKISDFNRKVQKIIKSIYRQSQLSIQQKSKQQQQQQRQRQAQKNKIFQQLRKLGFDQTILQLFNENSDIDQIVSFLETLESSQNPQKNKQIISRILQPSDLSGNKIRKYKRKYQHRKLPLELFEEIDNEQIDQWFKIFGLITQNFTTLNTNFRSYEYLLINPKTQKRALQNLLDEISKNPKNQQSIMRIFDRAWDRTPYNVWENILKTTDESSMNYRLFEQAFKYDIKFAIELMSNVQKSEDIHQQFKKKLIHQIANKNIEHQKDLYLLQNLSKDQKMKQLFKRQIQQKNIHLDLHINAKLVKYKFARPTNLKEIHEKELENFNQSKNRKGNYVQFLNNIICAYSDQELQESKDLFNDYFETYVDILKIIRKQKGNEIRYEPIYRIFKKVNLIEYDKKKQYLQKYLKQNIQSYPTCTIKVETDGENLLKQAFKIIMAKNKKSNNLLKLKIEQNRKLGSEATIGGGPLIQWFSQIFLQLKDPKYGLLTIVQGSNDVYTLRGFQKINLKKSFYKSDQEYYEYCQFIGRLIGMALTHQAVIPFDLSPALFKKIVKVRLGYHDLKQQKNQQLNKKFKFFGDPTYLINEDIDFEGLVVKDGDKIKVTPENIQQYKQKAAITTLLKKNRLQYKRMIKGIEFIMEKKQQFIDILSYRDLDKILTGITINQQLLRQHSWQQQDQQCFTMFWDIVKQFSPEQLRKLLFAITGYLRIPYGLKQEEKTKFIQIYSFQDNQIRIRIDVCPRILKIPNLQSLNLDFQLPQKLITKKEKLKWLIMQQLNDKKYSLL